MLVRVDCYQLAVPLAYCVVLFWAMLLREHLRVGVDCSYCHGLLYCPKQLRTARQFKKLGQCMSRFLAPFLHAQCRECAIATGSSGQLNKRYIS